ncbi:metalloregulator ArsR/SmtB family transcription factor [Microbacterium sp.]|uniref:ArsR/SmtB family transcription factor n=1 Tax=Microbacterium sp. TaxID=51671 RepID=UPI0027341727|nr:metalloregulator ArsR/SmtB family transcription factor [Microbacterium sp.]MDP3950661.1 metalloregulator ArsR/SmtB family transcription factor [Microbacterium sp.]
MDVFGAIADPVRRELLRRLVRGPARVVDLAADQSISRPAISKHLRILSDAGLVRAEVSGRERHYAIAVEPLAAVDELLRALTIDRALISTHHLDALDTEVHRAARDRRRGASTSNSAHSKEDIA